MSSGKTTHPDSTEFIPLTAEQLSNTSNSLSSVTTSEDWCGARGQHSAGCEQSCAGSAVFPTRSRASSLLDSRRCAVNRSRRRAVTRSRILRIFQFMNLVRFEILGFCGFRDFEDFEFRGIWNSLPFPCSAATTSCGRGSGARVARARGCEFRTRFRTSTHARGAPRSLRSKFGKIENFIFRNFGGEIWIVFGLPCS